MTKNYLLGLGLMLVCAGPALGQIKIVGGGLGGGFSRSISVTNENGMKTTRVTENGKKYVIREGEDSIEVEFANTYGPKDMGKLKEKHPDLHMHVTSFPKTTGNSTVEITIAVKEKVTAENESELKEKSEDAYAIFEKFTKKGGLGGPFGKLDIRGIDLGRKIELAPRLIEIEKDAEKRMEEMRKRVEELRKKAREPLFGKPEVGGAKSDKPKEGDDGKKSDKEKSDKSKKKKDLIDI